MFVCYVCAHKGTYTKTVDDLAGDLTSYSENKNKNYAVRISEKNRYFVLKAFLSIYLIQI